MKLGIALSALLLTAAIRAEEAAGMLTPQTFESEVKLKVGYPYLLALPAGYQKDAGKKMAAAGLSRSPGKSWGTFEIDCLSRGGA